ncbi:restriction endonuclease [Bombilactobacillus bombi]|uniref:Restriction endonuclease n=1 Tax=Bombilactobacillus bombi TaxID=1303590 RepID=A0A417Z496_9LACO|nr:BsuBI/PstI family type II restriction endonuclease [Bombilactobacillus bombi]RHW45420.1 restriction endonuclease [Bombilactobacillus bombi]
MSKILDACQILKDVGFSKIVSEKSMAARFILAATRITEDMNWKQASNKGVQIHEGLQFLNKEYNTNLKENTRESLRKQGPKKMATVGLARDNVSEGIPTNSKNYRWFLTDDFFNLIRHFEDPEYTKKLHQFRTMHKSRMSIEAAKRKKAMIPVKYNNFQFHLTPGKHNLLHKEILEQFAPRFAGGSKLLYVGDTSEKNLKLEKSTLTQIGFPMTMHEIIPDIILLDEKRNWLFLIEAVSSVGSMSIDRVRKIKSKYTGHAGLIFVTAFQDWSTYKRFVGDIAWETEVWIADFPDHMIHMNGDRFMGPYLK